MLYGKCYFMVFLGKLSSLVISYLQTQNMCAMGNLKILAFTLNLFLFVCLFVSPIWRKKKNLRSSALLFGHINCAAPCYETL